MNETNGTLSNLLLKVDSLKATWEKQVPQHIKTILEGDKQAAQDSGRLNTWNNMLNFWLDWFADVGLQCTNPGTIKAPQPRTISLNFHTPECLNNTLSYLNAQTTLPKAQTWGTSFQGSQLQQLPSTIASLFCPVGKNFTQINTPGYYEGESFIERTRQLVTLSPFAQYGVDDNTCVATGMPPGIMFSRTRELFLYLARNASLPNTTMAATTMTIALALPDQDSSIGWPPYVLGDGLNQTAWQQYSSLPGNVTTLAETMASAEKELSKLQAKTDELQDRLNYQQGNLNWHQAPEYGKRHFRNCFWSSTLNAGLFLDQSQIKPLFRSWVGLTTIGCTLLTLGMCAIKFNALQRRIVRQYWPNPETNNAADNAPNNNAPNNNAPNNAAPQAALEHALG